MSASAVAIWVDGNRQAQLPLSDRGLDYGDGVFETMVLAATDLLFQELHLQRLERGLLALHFPPCMGQVLQALTVAEAALGNSNGQDYALRLTVTRGSGPRGYSPPTNPSPRIIVSATPLPADWQRQQAPAQVGLARITWSEQPLLAGLKHLNRLEQVLASIERDRSGLDELIMLDAQGAAQSLCAANLFVYSNGVLCTPPVDRCGIAGTRRQLVLEQWAPKLQIKVAEQRILPEELLAAEEVFYCNSLAGLRPVARYQARQWMQHPVCTALHRCYQDAIL